MGGVQLEGRIEGRRARITEDKGALLSFHLRGHRRAALEYRTGILSEGMLSVCACSGS